MTYSLGQRSRNNLNGVNPALVAVVNRAIQITTQDFAVIEGVRSFQRQKQLKAQGKSRTLNSRHLTGHAVDLVDYPITWDWSNMYLIADAMIQAAKELDVPLRWGGNWQVKDVREWQGTAKELNEAYTGKFHDGPHYEIPKGYGYD